MSSLSITRLLQNPMGEPAPPGSAGDIVVVTDGTSTIYLTPAEYDTASEVDLRYRLAQTPLRAPRAAPHPAAS